MENNINEKQSNTENDTIIDKTKQFIHRIRSVYNTPKDKVLESDKALKRNISILVVIGKIALIIPIILVTICFFIARTITSSFFGAGEDAIKRQTSVKKRRFY